MHLAVRTGSGTSVSVFPTESDFDCSGGGPVVVLKRLHTTLQSHTLSLEQQLWTGTCRAELVIMQTSVDVSAT